MLSTPFRQHVDTPYEKARHPKMPGFRWVRGASGPQKHGNRKLHQSKFK
jgi:hypothetical protein